MVFAQKQSLSNSSATTLSLVIPVFNEVTHLHALLVALDTFEPGCGKELIIVDDCSHDGSHAIIDAFSFSSPCTYLRQNENRGKGAALRIGIQAASGEIIGIQDADFEYDCADIQKLIEPLMSGVADVVYGSRFMYPRAGDMWSLHYLGNRVLTGFSNLLSGLKLSDMETCYKFFNRDILKNLILESDRFGFEPEVTAKVARLSVRVSEVPISYRPRTYGEGKKITWRDGIAALWHIVRFNLLVNHQRVQQNVPREFRRETPNT